MVFVHNERWASFMSFAGAFFWALLAALAGAQRAPLGVMELLLLFALLVVVPLGLELATVLSPANWPAFENLARVLQPPAAMCAVGACWFGPGTTSGLLALPWAAVAGLVALSGVAGLRSSKSVVAFVSNLARIDLGIAGGWLLVSRLGVRPIGLQEPIILLTAIHFHYAGFGTALIAAAGIQFAERYKVERRLWHIAGLAIALLPFAVALGFVFSPLLKVVAAVVFAACVTVLALLLWRQSAHLLLQSARAFVRAACLFIFAGMALAAVYAVGNYLGREWLTVPRMASTHGWMNGMGFVMPGLLGWLAELNHRSRSSGERRQHSESISARVKVDVAPLPKFVAREFHDL